MTFEGSTQEWPNNSRFFPLIFFYIQYESYFLQPNHMRVIEGPQLFVRWHLNPI